MSGGEPIVVPLNSNHMAEFPKLMTEFYRFAGNPLPSSDEFSRLAHLALSSDNFFFFCAFVENQMAGIISTTFGESSYKVAPFAFADDLFVLEKFRGLGLGRLLLTAVADFARKRGCSNVLLATGESEVKALGFYQRLGYQDMRCKLLTLPL